MSQAEPRRKWRFPRLNLATMLVLVAVVGGSAGWYIHGVRVQRQAVRALLDAGATVAYDWEWDPDDAEFQGNGKELVGWRRIVAGRFGPDAVASVVAVSFDLTRGNSKGIFGTADEHIAAAGRLKSLRALQLWKSPATEEGAAPIAGLRHLRILAISDLSGKSAPGGILSRFGEDSRLERLILFNVIIDDDDLSAISRLSRLETLRIFEGHGEIGDAGMEKLAGLGRLKRLELPHTRITSGGLGSLARMKSLEFIAIDSSSIDDLAPLLRLPKLRELYLGQSLVADEDFAMLAEMPALKSFSLVSNALTDAGLAHLRKAPALETLTLYGNSITAAGLEPLAAIKTLKQIVIRGSKVLHEGVVEFANAHPNIRVVN